VQRLKWVWGQLEAGEGRGGVQDMPEKKMKNQINVPDTGYGSIQKTQGERLLSCFKREERMKNENFTKRKRGAPDKKATLFGGGIGNGGVPGAITEPSLIISARRHKGRNLERPLSEKGAT